MNTMPGPSNGGRTGSTGKKKDGKLVDNIRGACPPHRRKDLDSLIKLFNGDEEKIQAKIQEWWEEPQEEEEKWEDVNKRGLRSKVQRAPVASRGGGGNGRGTGRGGRSGRSSGRGGKDGARANGKEGGRPSREGLDRRPGGRGRGPRVQDKEHDIPQSLSDDPAVLLDETGDSSPPVPVDFATVQPPQDAWSTRVIATELVDSGNPEVKQVRSAPQANPDSGNIVPLQGDNRPTQLHSNPIDQSYIVQTETKPISRSAPASSGNVWATKGSAHLIQAEKPKVNPPLVQSSLPPPLIEQPLAVAPPLQSNLAQETAVESVLPSQLGNVRVPPWNSPSKSPKPAVQIPVPPSPVLSSPLSAIPTVSSVEATLGANPPPELPIVPLVSVPKVSVTSSVVSLPTNVLSMGHWETGESEDSQNIDFGFGSFGPDNDSAIIDTASAVSSAINDATTTPSEPGPQAPANSSAPSSNPPPALSPARPPPGLSISGMPPIPANAVLVHELESNLENASLDTEPDHSLHPSVTERSLPSTIPSAAAIMSSPPPLPTAAPVLPQQSYGQYSMAGMYGYGAAGNGFMGVHNPALAAGIIPKPPQPPSSGNLTAQQQVGSGVGVPLAQQQHTGLYGSSGPSSTASSQGASDNDASAATGPLPPTMPGGAIPYNPVYYGQQAFHHMGQPQGGIGYNYGYGAAQFGGGGGFGYQQVMGQSGGYHGAAPPYDEQAHSAAASHHAGSTGGYQKTTGYRGRGSHHSGNQYQNQYNPPSGYGGQPPYGMGYGVDHFSQRGVAYGPQGAMDPYMQQQQGSAGAYPSSGIHRGNFQDEDQYKKKGRNNGSSNLQQFSSQPHGPNPTGVQHLSGQQPQQQQHSFGLPQSGAASQNSETGSSSGAWSNHHGSGWSSVPTWQGN